MSRIVLEFSGFRLEPERRRLTTPEGEALTLRARDFETLLALVQRAGTPVSKEDLIATVWPGSVVEENNLNQAISKLRQILGDDRHDPKFIATLPGRGYQFIASVRQLVADDENDANEVTANHRRRSLLAAVSIAILAGVALWWSVDTRQAPSVVISLEAARLVTQSPASNTNPALSGDGTFMAFVSDRSGTPQIWVKGLPDGKPIQITEGDNAAASPAWSPVDDTILFQRVEAGGAPSIWRTDALRSNPPSLVQRRAVSPRFADGRSFTFSRGYSSVYVATLDGNDVRRIEGIPKTPGFAFSDPAMNADGDIAFVLADEGPSGNLWLYDEATATVRQLTRSNNEYAGVWARSPVWTADGETIVYIASDGFDSNTHIWRINATSGETEKLSAGAGGYTDVTISGDGSRLAYSFVRPISRLIRSNFSTGVHRVLHESRDGMALPVVSADGTSVVYFYDNVYVVPSAGGDPVQLTFQNPGEATLPVWSRSESMIFYYNKRTLHRLDPATGESQLIVDDFHWSSRNWLAVHDDVLAYHIRGKPVGGEAAVVLNLGTGEELLLDEALMPTDFSRDGQTLLGVRRGDSAIMTCKAPTFSCEAITHVGEAVDGAIPRWSADESRVFFRRARDKDTGFADIWVVAREGGEPERLGEIGPYQSDNMYFGVAEDDSIIWNQYDSNGRSEIWVVDLE